MPLALRHDLRIPRTASANADERPAVHHASRLARIHPHSKKSGGSPLSKKVRGYGGGIIPQSLCDRKSSPGFRMFRHKLPLLQYPRCRYRPP